LVFAILFSQPFRTNMSQSKSMNFTQQLAFKAQGTNKNEFECLHPPNRAGNTANIAYGGYALATAAKAACLSVPPTYHLYSMLGDYLGPALSDRPLCANVRTIRQTRTFATRLVEISQTHDNGKDRTCLICTIDFQTVEPASLLEYSQPPSMHYTHYSTLAPRAQVFQKLRDDGKITQAMLDEQQRQFGIFDNIFNFRPCPEGSFAQNLYGIAKTLPTTQDHLPITSRTTADWVCSYETLESAADQVAYLAFLMDGGLVFAPLAFSNMWFDDISANSSLDFALRVFGGVDMGKWGLRETKTREASKGRTFGEAWLWDEGGRAVACMSQMGILRPAKGRELKL